MHTRSKWVALALGTAAQTTGTIYLYGLPFLLPALRESTGMTLPQLGILLACPSIGMVVALLGWGALADRHGERLIIGAGLGLGGLLLGLAGLASGALMGILLILAGAAGSAVYAASGRLVVAWFAPDRRGLAMGIRQASQPVGVAVAGVTLPAIAEQWGTWVAFVVPGGICQATALVTTLLLAPAPRTTSGSRESAVASPYRTGSSLWRVHATSALLVIGQLTVGTFAFDYLVLGLGWTPTTAGPLLAAAQLAGAAARIGAGRWSDLSSGKGRALRRLALVNTCALAALATAAALEAWTSAGLLIVAIVATVSWHGVGYAAVAELVHPSWSGRAMSVQTIVQNLASSATPPVMGTLIASLGYVAGFGAAALFPLAAMITMTRLSMRPAQGPAR
ncbi:MFS transporter [Nonomuraea turkmeniaca]|uniref:MFS transporter n=1 Tax=Nonomuraea turkmeniaca TaxID=103838 RepID=A0A5S4FCE4_9ACTN|nr:MFS transporter [Nonomuraea turkmeniaca]TMR15515.1 MFS transporter [Nonomuraea turkmeniaca]